MRRSLIGVACCLTLLAGAASLPAEAQRAGAGPANYEGLVQVAGTRFDSVWVAPDVDFRTYRSIKLDRTEVAFRRNWQRDFNATTRGTSGRVTDRDAARMLDMVQTGFQDEFSTVFRSAGFPIATEAAPDVMRVKTAVINVEITAPDRQSPGRRDTFARDAGRATLVLEVRDSMSGAVIARVVDSRVAGDSLMFRRNQMTNRNDFRAVFRGWANTSLEGLQALRARSPSR